MNEKVNAIIGKLLESFESGNVPEAISIAVLPSLDVPCSKWSITNRLICLFEGTSDARGFRQWQEVGRYPKKGSKAIYILSPKHRKVGDGKVEEEKVVLTGFLTVPVFRVEDTEGKALEVLELEPQERPPLSAVAESWGINVRYQGFVGNAYGSYSPGRKEITLATHDESVFFHELAHAAHEKVKGKLELGQDWKQEIVAELTAAVLMHLHGRRTNDGHSYRYIRSYAEKAGKDVHKACLSVLVEVGKCLEVIAELKKQETDISV